MGKITIKLFAIVLTLGLFSSCVVTKKKYEALENKLAHRTDSLNDIVSDYQTDFNTFMNESQTNESHKTDIIDSLLQEINNLSSTTVELKQSLKDAITEYETEKKKFGTLSTELENKKNELQNMEAELDKKDKELLDLQEMVNKNKAETEKLKNTIGNALKSFDSSELTVFEKNGKVYVSLAENLLFKTGSAQIGTKGKDAILQLTNVLEKSPDISVLVEGHTDNVGSPEVNWKLSAERALEVVKIIESNSSIDMKRITAAGRGMYAPVSDNDTKEGKAQNRRIEIILTPDLRQLYNIFDK